MKKRFEALVLVVIIALLVAYRVRSVQREHALARARASAQAGLALVRYVQLHRHCSEAVAYQRIAAFVEKHTPSGEHPRIDHLLASDRQRLLALAQSILMNHPDEIDEI